MLSRFCPTCAKENKYTIDKPKFCAFCGQKFDFSGGSSQVITSTPKTQVRQNIDFGLEIDNTPEEPIEMNLGFELEGVDDRKIKFGDIYATSKVSPPKIKGQKMTKQARKEMVDNFLNSAKNTRKVIEMGEEGSE